METESDETSDIRLLKIVDVVIHFAYTSRFGSPRRSWRAERRLLHEWFP
jgi:hypothetical protein